MSLQGTVHSQQKTLSYGDLTQAFVDLFLDHDIGPDVLAINPDDRPALAMLFWTHGSSRTVNQETGEVRAITAEDEPICPFNTTTGKPLDVVFDENVPRGEIVLRNRTPPQDVAFLTTLRLAVAEQIPATLQERQEQNQ